MNGTNFLIDTNILIYLTQGKLKTSDFARKGSFLYISSITYIEALGYSFLNKDEEGPCGCGLYYKEERTPSEIDKYMNTKLKWDEKKEKEIEKQLTKEEKENKKKQEKLEYEDD